MEYNKIYKPIYQYTLKLRFSFVNENGVKEDSYIILDYCIRDVVSGVFEDSETLVKIWNFIKNIPLEEIETQKAKQEAEKFNF